MIFKTIAVMMMLFFASSFAARLFSGAASVQEEPEEEENRISYEIIDSIARERDRARGIEDMLSWAKCYEQGETERMLRLSWTDCTGSHEFETFVSYELIDYLEAERDHIRTSLTRKIKTF